MPLCQWLTRRTLLRVLVLFVSIVAVSSRAQTPAVDPLEGVWGAELRLGTPVQGELILDGREAVWRAFIGGFQVNVDKKDGELRFTLPGNVAEFRGVQDAASNLVRGQWIQQGGSVLDAQYASPIQLHSIAPSVWRGTVTPLDQRLSLYINISSKDSKMTATITNPEGNFFRRRVYAVVREGANIAFETKGNKIEGKLDENSGVLSLQVVKWLPQFQFTRRGRDEAIGFFPRTPASAGAWTYHEPLPDGDGWAVSSIQAEGLREAPIRELAQRILAADPASTTLKIQSLLIARHGHLVLEEYFGGFDQDRPHDMRSASKTFAPLLAGLARDQGAKLTPETPIYALFTQYSSFANEDERKREITLRDIMTMTAGNACDDNNDQSPGNEDRMQGDSQRHDWYKYTLDLPMLKSPGGEDAVYCSADLNLVGGAVAAATGRWLPEFFEEKLARPLQFGRYYLNLMPDGQAYMGGGAYLRPRDQLKLGQLYLKGGVWNGRRIVSKDWVADSISVHSHFSPAYSLGQPHDYGYGWHIHTLKSEGKTYRVFAAEGNGGQLVVVVPDLDLVIGLTGGSYGEFDQWYRWELELIPQFIIPAAFGNIH